MKEQKNQQKEVVQMGDMSQEIALKILILRVLVERSRIMESERDRAGEYFNDGEEIFCLGLA